jgi:hypothetical protein
MKEEMFALLKSSGIDDPIVYSRGIPAYLTGLFYGLNQFDIHHDPER